MVGIQGYSIYFLALLIVECILMGATISTGALCAILMILFVLPGMLAAFDRFIIRKKKQIKEQARTGPKAHK